MSMRTRAATECHWNLDSLSAGDLAVYFYRGGMQVCAIAVTAALADAMLQLRDRRGSCCGDLGHCSVEHSGEAGCNELSDLLRSLW